MLNFMILVFAVHHETEQPNQGGHRRVSNVYVLQVHKINNVNIILACSCTHTIIRTWTILECCFFVWEGEGILPANRNPSGYACAPVQ